MPAASRLADEGALFPDTFCQMPKCVPSRCSMLTGRYPHVDGFRTLRGKRPFNPSPHCSDNDFFSLTEDVPNLIPMVREAGFRTCLLGKNHVVDWNLHRVWFDKTPSWDFNRVPKTEENPVLLRASYTGDVPADFPLDRHQDAVTAAETIDFIRCADSRPFFALVDMSLPHPGYQTFGTMPVASRDLAELPSPPLIPLAAAPFVEQALRRSKNLESLTDTDRRMILRAYWSMCEFADRQVEKILNALDESGQAENTLVIYTADHGDFAADHNCYEKWDTCFLDGIVRVPFLLRLPGKIPAGWRGDAMVELVDCFPTIVDLLGLPMPAGTQGRSLWPVIEGRETGWRGEVICQGGVESAALSLAASADTPGADPVKQKVLIDTPAAMARAKMVRTKKWKYIHRLEGGHELYDMDTDPHELNNRINDPTCGDVLIDLRNRLLNRLIEAEPCLPEIGRLYA